MTHYFPAENLDKLKEVFKFDGAPFVGGPDLIKNGIVIPPIKIEYIVMEEEFNFVEKEKPPSCFACFGL